MPPPSRPISYPASASCAIKNTPERSTLYFEQRAKHVASKLFTSDRRPRRTYLITYLDDPAPLSLTGPLTYEEAHEQAMTYAKQISSLGEQHARAVGFGLYTRAKASAATPHLPHVGSAPSLRYPSPPGTLSPIRLDHRIAPNDCPNPVRA